MAKRTEKVFSDAEAVCHECGKSSNVKDAFRWARKHAVETGHSPTLIVTYDIHALTAEGQL